MTEKNMEDAKLVCFRSVVLLQDWITCKALALEEKSWIMDQTAEQKYLALISHLTRSCITSDILKSVTTLIFDKAILEPTFCPMYAQLCCDICDKMPRFPSAEPPMVKEITFRRVLLNTIQFVFEGTDELSNEIRKMNAPDQEEERKDTERLLSKLRTLGNLRFCGELFLKRKIPEKIVHRIVQKLLGVDEKMCPSEENLEALCLFLKTVGKKLDGSESVESSLSLTSSKQINDVYFRLLESLSNRPQMSMRIKFMIRNIIDLRSNHWIPSGKESYFYPLKQQRKIGDSFQIDVTLPKLLYNIGQEPNSDVRINQCARDEYIDKVQRVISAIEFQRIRKLKISPSCVI